MSGFAYFIHEQPLALIGAILFVVLLLLRELGGRIRQWAAGRVDLHEADADKGFIMSGVLGLLALLIAFTFNLSVDRYEARRRVVVAEANAISTAEMRVQLLPSPAGAQLSQMLRDYARTRLAYGLGTFRDKEPLAQRAARQRDALQAATLAALRPVATTPLAPFVGESINSVLDIGVEREALNAARVPATVLGALILYTLLSAGLMGGSLTGAKARYRPATAILFALLTLAILVILDLDRPQRGSIRIDQTAMIRLVAGFPPTQTAGGPAPLPRVGP